MGLRQFFCGNNGRYFDLHIYDLEVVQTLEEKG